MRTHLEMKDQLQDYLENLLPESDHQKLEKHLSSCPECQNEIVELRDIIRELNSLPVMDPPAGFSTQVMSRIHRIQKPQSIWDSWKSWIPKLGYAYLAGLVILSIPGYLGINQIKSTQWSISKTVIIFSKSLIYFAKGLALLYTGLEKILRLTLSYCEEMLPQYGTYIGIELVIILAIGYLWYSRNQKQPHYFFAQY